MDRLMSLFDFLTSFKAAFTIATWTTITSTTQVLLATQLSNTILFTIFNIAFTASAVVLLVTWATAFIAFVAGCIKLYSVIKQQILARRESERS